MAEKYIQMIPVHVEVARSIRNAAENSFGIMYGIVYADKENAYEKREQMKADLEQEYRKNKEPSDAFMNIWDK